MSIRSSIAQAVVETLNAAAVAVPSPFGRVTFTAQRLNEALFDLADMKTLHVTVVARSADIEVADRSHLGTEIKVDVAIQQKVAGNTPAIIDPMNDLVEQFITLLSKPARLAGYPAAMWRKTENPMLYIPEHLKKDLFSSVITLTYRVVA